jgi:hypothetical protein
VYLAAIDSYGQALVRWWQVIVVAVPVVASWSLAPVRAAAARMSRFGPLGAIALIALLGVAVWYAWHLLWFADDAFISLHYARNWIEGNGLVFNPGERVEGYTNFLWLALIAACGRLGLDMPLATVGLNLLAYLATIVLVRRAVQRLISDHEVIASFAAVMTALSYPMVSFATGGLETMFCALLVLAAAIAAHEDRTLAAGTYGIAATIAHPDHAVFYVAIAAVVLASKLRSQQRSAPAPWWRRPAVSGLVRYAAPFVIVYVPYFVLRWRYYGDPLPNTFYAKAGGGAYYGQGLRYLFASALVAGVVGVLPAFAVGAYRLRRTVFGQIIMVSLPLYLCYVTLIGGDFMIGRLLVPVLPLVFVVAEIGVRTSRDRPRLAALLAVPLVLACLPTSIHKPGQPRWYLTDERTYYPVETLHPMTVGGPTAPRAEALHKYFPDAGPELHYAAHEIGYLAWRTRLHIVDMHGLTDRELARMPLTTRTRPGHEHNATASYVLGKGAMLSAIPLYDPPYSELTRLVLDGVIYYLAQYRTELLAIVRGKPGVVFTELPRYIDDYLATASSVPPERFAADLAFLDAYYFSVNRDPARRAALLAARSGPH